VNWTSKIGNRQSTIDRVSQYGRRKALVAAASRAAVALIAFLSLALAALVVDRLVELPRLLRPVLPLAALLVPGALLASLLLFLRTRDAERLAGELDAFYPRSRDVLRTALSLLRRQSGQPRSVNPFMLAETLRLAQAFSDTVRPTEAAPLGRVPLRFAAAGVLVGTIAGLFFWPYMAMDILLQRALHPLGNHPRPSLTRIGVSGPLLRDVPSGDDVSVEVQLSGAVPGDPRAASLPKVSHLRERIPAPPSRHPPEGYSQKPSGGGAELHVVHDAREEFVLMTPRPGHRFETALKGVASSALFYVTAGDGRSAMYRVRVIPRPTVTGLRVRCDYPPYTRLPRTEGPIENRQVAGVVGTQVRLDFESSLPVADSDLTLGRPSEGYSRISPSGGNRTVKIRWDKARTRGSAAFRIERDDTFRINLIGDDGADNRHDPVYRIRAIQDNPPTVAFTDVPTSTSFFRDDILRLRYIGSDDFGISEAFLRCRQEPKGDPPVREWSIDLPQANARSVAGQIAVNLRELADESATAVHIQLVMVDTHGEEGYAPALRLQIVADNAVTQLRDLLAFQEAYEAQLAATASALAAKVGQLGILIDSLDDSTALTAKRKEMLRNVDKQLGPRMPPEPDAYSLIRRGGGPVVFRSFPFTEYPYHALRQTEACLGSWAVLRSVRFSEPELQAIENSPTPRQRLVETRRRIEDQKAQVQPLAAAFADTLQETRLRLLFLLTEEYLADIPAPQTQTRQDLAAELAAEKQRERMDAIRRLASEVAKRAEDPELLGALASLGSTAAPVEQPPPAPPAQGDPAPPSALRKVYERLLTGSELDGRLGKQVETYRRSHGPADEIRKARGAGALDLCEEALALQMRLRRDDYVVNDAELLLAARVYEALLTGDGARIDTALRATEQLADWSQRGDALNRLRLLRHGMSRLSDDTRLGRLRLDSPELTVRWQAVRELFLSLICDQNAGQFAELPGPAREELAKLGALREVLGSGLARRVITDPRYATASEAVAGVTGSVIAHLRPTVEKESPLALALTGELLRDLAANLRAESLRVRAEIEAIDKEAGPKGPEPQDRTAFRAILKDQGANRPTPGRERFSVLHTERMACHAIALAKVLDIRQLIAETSNANDETAAANILAEYLAHLEEETYDKVVAIHRTGYGTPTIFAVAAREFYQGAAPRLAKLGEWAERLAADQGAQLLKIPEYADLLRSVHKDTRHRSAMDSLASQREFLRTFDAMKSPQERKTALHAMLGRESEAMAYWQLLRLAIGDLSAQVQAASLPKGYSQKALREGIPGTRGHEDTAEYPPEGVKPSGGKMTADDRKRIDAAVEHVRWLLPPPGAAPVEAKPLAGLLEEFGKRADRLAVGSATVGLSDRAASDTAGQASRGTSEEERRAAVEDLAEWHGRLLAAMQGMDARVSRPPVPYRPRIRYQRRIRTDLEHRLGQILRNEERWAHRVAEAGWDVLDARARAFAGTADRDEVCWLAAWEQTCRRKSAAVVAQQSRALELEDDAPDDRFIKMPPYLYKELRRALSKPYPTQFKAPALEYMRGLMNDAR